MTPEQKEQLYRRAEQLRAAPRYTERRARNFLRREFPNVEQGHIEAALRTYVGGTVGLWSTANFVIPFGNYRAPERTVGPNESKNHWYPSKYDPTKAAKETTTTAAH